MVTQSNAWGDNMKHMQIGDSDIPSISNQQMPPPHHAGHSKPAGTPQAAVAEAVSVLCSPVPPPVDQLCVYACIPTCICLDICHHSSCMLLHIQSLMRTPCHNFFLQSAVIINTCCQLLACMCKSRQMILHGNWNADLLNVFVGSTADAASPGDLWAAEASQASQA